MFKAAGTVKWSEYPIWKYCLMTKSLFEQSGGTYYEENGHLIPNLRLPDEEEQPIDLFRQRDLCYLKEYRKSTYINLLTSGKMNTYLADINKKVWISLKFGFCAVKTASETVRKKSFCMSWCMPCKHYNRSPRFRQ